MLREPETQHARSSKVNNVYADSAINMSAVHTRYGEVEAYVTKDGSVVRELMHPNVHGNSNMSLAEAVVAVGQTTLLHK